MSKLLTRDEFRETVFTRDHHKCVFCEKPAVDAHHIIERRLWSDGGYYLDNGASVCEEHHLACERTDISVEEVREACGITTKVLPAHMYDDVIYDKWGNPILENGQRTRGELFFDSSVQKIIAEHLGEFTNRVKFPRTYHLPWSDGMNSDDRMIPNLDGFQGKEVVVTIKMDGENTTMYNDYIHARSVDGRHHASRNWVKNFWSCIAQDIPKDWRICGENLFATHSIHYKGLPSYFMGFSVWNETNSTLNWDETQEWFKLLGIESVPVIYRGIFDEEKIKKLYTPANWVNTEGYVVRTVEGFPYKDYKRNVAKFVRKGHIQTVKHWMHGQPIVPNELK